MGSDNPNHEGISWFLYGPWWKPFFITGVVFAMIFIPFVALGAEPAGAAIWSIVPAAAAGISSFIMRKIRKDVIFAEKPPRE